MYLKEVQEYRDNGHLMFCMHQTWTDSNLTFRKCWQKGEVLGIHTHVNSGNRLTMLHIGGIGGFLPPCTFHLHGWTWSRRLPWTNECNKFWEVGSQETYLKLSTSVSNCFRYFSLSLSPGWQTIVNLHSKNRHNMALQEGYSVWWDHEQKWLTS